MPRCLGLLGALDLGPRGGQRQGFRVGRPPRALSVGEPVEPGCLLPQTPQGFPQPSLRVHPRTPHTPASAQSLERQRRLSRCHSGDVGEGHPLSQLQAEGGLRWSPRVSTIQQRVGAQARLGRPAGSSEVVRGKGRPHGQGRRPLCSVAGRPGPEGAGSGQHAQREQMATSARPTRGHRGSGLPLKGPPFLSTGG